MMSLNANEIIKKIVSEKGLSEDEVRSKIKEKLDKLNGLISESGAAHIVANELGVDLYKTEGLVKVKELSTFSKNVVINLKVLKKYEVRSFNKDGREGKVANVLLGDETGIVRLVLWNDQVDDFYDKFVENSVVQIKNPFVKSNNNRLELAINKNSELVFDPEGVVVNTKPAPTRKLKYIKDLNPGEEVEVLGAVVHVYDPRFFMVCSECGKRLVDDKCPVHGVNSGEEKVVTTLQLDDGTGSVRVTFWKDQTLRLFGLDDLGLLKNDFDSLKHDLLGEIIKVVGFVKSNEQFNRLELTANLVFKDVDPDEELKRLDDKLLSNNKEESKEEKVDDGLSEKNDDLGLDDEVVVKPVVDETDDADDVSLEEEVIDLDDL